MNKIHRIGTITLGGMLVTFGSIFLAHLFAPNLSYDVIFRLWPIIFIFLGFEILIANFRKNEEALIYDKAAIALIIVFTFFAMGMAVVQLFLEYARYQLTLQI